MKTTTAFRMLTENRRRERLAARKFVVRRINRDGSVSKMRPHDLDCLATAEEAEKRIVALKEMNPGSEYTVVEEN